MSSMFLLGIVFFVSGCIFGDDKKNETGSNIYNGTWVDYHSGGTSCSTLKLSNYDKETQEGVFLRNDYTIGSNGTRSLTYSMGGNFYIELKSDGFAEDNLVLNFYRNGELEDSVYYSISTGGNKLTISGWEKE